MNICKQQAEFDCMLACITTAVQRPYEELWPQDFRAKIEEKRGCYGDVIDLAFEIAGLRKNTDYWCVNIPEFIPLSHVRNLLNGRRAILQVRSLNVQGWHLVYWAGEQLYDPSNKQTYQWIDQCYPVYVWIFDETLKG
jgi:hypothetical protein